MTAYWGFLPTTSKPYPTHARINAFVGRKGHGKTTAWDAIRIVLGDASFENKRSDSYYIHPDSNWAVVRLGIDNIPDTEGNRPFGPRKYYNDTVVLCCRISKSGDGGRLKDYYIFDQEFTDIIDLGKNPRAYRTRQIKSIREYNQILYDCMGISDQFRRLMAMNPDRVRELITLSPNELFRRVFDLTGNKKYKDNYDNAKAKLNELSIEVERTKRELTEAINSFEESKRKAEAYDRYILNVSKLNKFERKLKVVRYAETKRETSKIKELIKSISVEVQRLEEESLNLVATKKVLQAEIEQISANITVHSQAFNEYGAKAILQATAVGTKETSISELSNKINYLQNIQRIDMEIFNAEAIRNSDAYAEKAGLRKQYESERENHTRRLSELNQNYNAKPFWVESFTSSLSENSVDYIVLANTISVKKGYEKWQRAVEAYLGGNRYRIIVPPDQFVKAKKLQEERRYKARICIPKSTILKRPNSSIPYPTIWSILDIDKMQQVGHYISHLQDVYLVDTVEEGDGLQQRGIESITLQGLLQDHDGSIFRDPSQLCCGQYAIELEKVATENALKVNLESLKDIEPLLSELRVRKEHNDNVIKEQQDLGRLPEYEQRLSNLNGEIKEIRSLLNTLLENQSKAGLEKDRLQEEKLNKSNKVATSKQRIETNETEIKRSERELIEKGILFDTLNNLAGDIVKELRKIKFSDDDIEFIERDVQNSLDYRNEGGQIFTSDEILTHCRKLTNAIDDFKRTYPDVNEGYSTIVRSNETVLESLQASLANLDTQRHEWEASCNNDLISFKSHIKEMANDYLEEFKHLSELMNARGGGSLEPVGDDNPEAWQLHMSIGFDGKNPTSSDGPELSSGQRACTSLMLLLAAINNRKRGEVVPVMFLDEPNSRVDDDTGNEIGHLLQASKLQYFITHQMGEAIKNITWFNHVFIVSIKEPQERFSQPMIFVEAKEIDE